MDEFDRMMPWVRGWFVPADAGDARLPEDERRVLNELAARWDHEEKIPLFNRLAAEYGPVVDRAMESVIARRVTEEWRGIAAQQPSNRLEEFIRLLWEPLREQGFRFTVEPAEDGVRIDCRACPLAEWARVNGADRWMYILVCGTDPHMLAGFNPALAFRRTRTLMQGHDRCDHAYADPAAPRAG